MRFAAGSLVFVAASVLCSAPSAGAFQSRPGLSVAASAVCLPKHAGRSCPSACMADPDFVRSRKLSRTVLNVRNPFARPSEDVTDIADDDSDDDSIGWSFNPFYGTLWALFILYAFTIAPDSPNTDVGILQAVFANPQNPEGVNELFLVVFNSLGIVPVLIACLAAPQGSKKGVPLAPFAALSLGSGFFGIGPYLTVRAPPVESKTLDEMGWFGRNVLENKAVNWLNLALLLSLPLTTGVVANADSWSSMVQGYKDLFDSCKLVNVSTVDLLVLSVVGASLIPKDYALRTDGVDEGGIGKRAALATLLFPAVGIAAYCVWRPKLPEA